MDKKTFLEELRKSLRILKEEELQDIIGEYEQHIDLKVKKGLTEEQAIADFGNIKELAAEILEAYHVRAEFSFSEQPLNENDPEIDSGAAVNSTASSCASTNDSTEAEDDTTVKASILERAGEILCLGGKWIASKIRYLLHMICSTFGWCGKQLIRPIHWFKEKIIEKKKQYKNRQTQKVVNQSMTQDDFYNADLKACVDENGTKVTKIQVKGLFRRVVRGAANMVHSIWNWTVDIIILCIRVCWNCCAVGTAFLIGGFGLICLYIAGVLAVLWLQGYPLAGLTIGCIGVVLSLFAGAAFAWTMIWRKAKVEKSVDAAIDKHPADEAEMEVSQNA